MKSHVIAVACFLTAVLLLSGTGCVSSSSSGPPRAIIADVQVAEGDSSTTNMIFVVSLSKNAKSDVEIDYVTGHLSDTAEDESGDNDYLSSSGTVFIPQGTDFGTIVITVNGDTTVESDETLTVILSNPVNAVISDDSATGTILDDDEFPQAVIDDPSVTEGDAGTVTLDFTVTLSRNADANVTIDYVTSDGTAEDENGNNDYLSASGQVFIAAGTDTGTISITVNGDTDDEPDETFTVTLSNPVNAEILDVAGTGTILNDDAPPEVDISGTVTFDSVVCTQASGLDYSSTLQKPVRGAVIEALLDADSSLIDSASTDASGAYSLTVPENTTVFIRVKARMYQTGTPSWDFQIVDNTSSQALYVMDSSSFDSGTADITDYDLNADSGWGGASYTSTRAAGPFAILDMVYDTAALVLSADANIQFPQLLINWSINNVPVSGNKDIGQIGTSHYDLTANELFILGAENNDTDEYDIHVIAHEWGHYLEFNFSRSDSIGGSHGALDKLDPRLAFGEGWGNSFSGMSTNDPDYIDTMGSQQGTTGVWMDLEDNTLEESNEGWFSEAAIQIILYDLYDSNDDGVDTLSLGFGPIFNVLKTSQKNADSFTTIYSFIAFLKDYYSSSPATVTAINTLVSGESITTTAADEWDSTATETNNAGNGDSLPVYVKLVDGAAAVQISCDDVFGSYNKLLNRHYFYFEITVAGNYTIEAAHDGNADPDFIIYKNGVEIVRSETTSNPERLSNHHFDAGIYCGEIYEWTAIDGSGTQRETFDVTLD